MAAADEVLSVGELSRRLKRAVEGQGALWVEGEVGSLTRPQSGHVYFSLKDEREDALIDCVVYKFNAMRARQHLAEGNRIQVRGRATVWSPRGKLQFVGEAVRPAGRGALLEALERLKKKLALEGLFDPTHKRALKADIRCIGIVTSKTGAAFHDIRTVAFRRGARHLVLAPALVQGDGAPDSILRALDLIERHPLVDVIILGRGGGSDDDLMAFNDERVVRRVRAARVPVVSAVGHEIDTSLVDLAADIRAATPSQAAELVVADAGSQRALLAKQRALLERAALRILARRAGELSLLRARLPDPRFYLAELGQEVDDFRARLERRVRRGLAERRLLLERSTRRLRERHPRSVIAKIQVRLRPLEARLTSAMRLRLERASRAASEARGELEALSPRSVLARGYAIASVGAQGSRRILRAASEVLPGDAVELELALGRLGLQVIRVDDGQAGAKEEQS